PPLRLDTCTPHGLALGPHPFAIVGCNGTAHSFVLDITTGATTEIPQVGGSDEVWYNPGDNRYYLAANANTKTVAGLVGTTLNPVLGIVDAATNSWVANVPTAVGAHSVAADPTNQQVFVPLTNGAVGIYTQRALTPGAPLAPVPAPTAPTMTSVSSGGGG